MTKFLVFSDLHIHNYKQFNKGNGRLFNTLSVLRNVFQRAEKEGIKTILFTGDLFDKFGVMSNFVVNRTLETFRNLFSKYSTITFITLSGNHDFSTKNLIDKPAESSLNYLSTAFPTKFLIIDDGVYNCVGQDIQIHGIEYFDYPEHFREALEECVEGIKKGKEHSPDTTHILMMHQTVWDTDIIPNDIEADDPLFEAFDLVLNGHIHEQGIMATSFYNIGSPLHRDASDIGKSKGGLVIEIVNEGEINTMPFNISDSYPVFINKEHGAELSPWEKDQYVIWTYPQIENKEERIAAKKFQSNLAPAELITNFCAALKFKDKELALTKGLKYIS